MTSPIQHSASRPPSLARLVRALRRHGITQAQIAFEASKTSKFGTTCPAVVSGVLSGRNKSKNIVTTARRLLAEAKDGGTTTSHHHIRRATR